MQEKKLSAYIIILCCHQLIYDNNYKSLQYLYITRCTYKRVYYTTISSFSQSHMNAREKEKERESVGEKKGEKVWKRMMIWWRLGKQQSRGWYCLRNCLTNIFRASSSFHKDVITMPCGQTPGVTNAIAIIPCHHVQQTQLKLLYVRMA